MVLAEKRAFGLVHNVVLMGAPVPTETRVWATMRSVVTGRLANAYSHQDYLLGFLSRGTNWKYGVAGLQDVRGVAGVENVDLGDLAHTHLRYQHLTTYVLEKLAWDDLKSEQISLDKREFDALVESERMLNDEPSVDLDHEAQVVAEILESREKAATAHRKANKAASKARGHGPRRKGQQYSGNDNGSKQYHQTTIRSEENRPYSQDQTRSHPSTFQSVDQNGSQVARGNTKYRDLPLRQLQSKGRNASKK